MYNLYDIKYVNIMYQYFFTFYKYQIVTKSCKGSCQLKKSAKIRSGGGGDQPPYSNLDGIVGNFFCHIFYYQLTYHWGSGIFMSFQKTANAKPKHESFVIGCHPKLYKRWVNIIRVSLVANQNM